jgi:hypothetical protein
MKGLAGDLISIITKYVQLKDVYNLYLMGNVVFTYKMKYNDIYLICSYFNYKSIRFPNIKITYIQIDENHDTKFNEFPVSLITLKLNGYNAIKNLPQSLKNLKLLLNNQDRISPCHLSKL